MGAYYGATVNKKRYKTWPIAIGAKLMEHAYIGNEYIERIMSLLEKEPKSLNWLCDYTDDQNELTWGNTEAIEEYEENTYEINSNYIILNTTKKLYIDMKEFQYLNKNRTFIIHPLPLLCNSEPESMGGGDYHTKDSRRSTWKNDMIQITYDIKDLPKDYKNVTEESLFYEE